MLQDSKHFGSHWQIVQLTVLTQSDSALSITIAV